jgi:hypothetical protein
VIGYNPCLLSLCNSRKEDLARNDLGRSRGKENGFGKNEKSKKMETWKE